METNPENQEAIQSGEIFLIGKLQKGRPETYIGNDQKFEEVEPSAPESFTTLVIVEILLHSTDIALPDGLVEYIRQRSNAGYISFWEDPTVLPLDIDTISVGCLVCHKLGILTKNQIEEIAKKITEKTNEEGILNVYLDDGERANRSDHIAATNALRLLQECEQIDRAQPTLNWVVSMLRTRQYLNGARYYSSPNTFLYFFFCLLEKSPTLKAEHIAELKLAVVERLASNSTNIIDIAIMVYLGKKLGIDVSTQEAEIRAAQRMDGSWDVDAFFKYGRRNIHFGSRALSTTFAIQALSTH